ncbi:MAG: SulP family inorganic anion transporter, partial [Thermoplasmata archaeon]|nr:SulP family inorganic anion transporter [Thermoplasmata archaeon]
NQDAGSMTRFGGVFAGAVVILAIAVFGPVFEFIPMAALSGLLIFIGAEILLKQVPKIKEGWYTSRSYSISMFATFIISIVYSLEVGVFTGIILSMVLYVYFSSKEIQLIALEPLEGKQFRILSPPKEFPSGEVTIIQQQGTRYYAAITVMEEMMPSWDNTNDAVIIFSIYGRSLMSSNMVDLVESMHKEMTEGGNRLILANVEGPIMEQMERTGLLDLLGRENVFPAEEIVGASIWKALESANETLGRDEKE